MNLREAVRIALRGLRAHRLRSVLTMLGIIIGVAAVILLVAIGNGVQASVNAKIQPLANLITITPTTGKIPGGAPPRDLIDGDVEVLSRQLSNAAAVIPAVTGQTLAETDTNKYRADVVGSTEDWLGINNRDLEVGAFFDQAQVRSATRVVVLGPTVANVLFGGSEAALHKPIRFNHQTFQVIGVMQSAGEPADNNVVMPLDSARRYLFGGGDKLNQITVQADQASDVPAVQDQVITILSDRHRIQDPANRDFEVQSLRSRLDAFNQILSILTLFTASVASISLIVGAIGVLNIMLVSVTERTREIGIRKAIGATRRAILQQFLIEAVVLAGLGGLIGIAVGVGLSVLGAHLAPSLGPTLSNFAPAVSIPSVLLSFGISLAIGIIAGGYPANRAARLRPVEALRYQ
ncbi:MAG: ABC transporter permease [Pseudonocardiales bacterium]|jgi:putative ABC transport system permease protein|nr:ABC transporter permease [Pseudonocardiales bacterium]